MSELDDALAMLERAVARLEAAPLVGGQAKRRRALAAEREARGPASSRRRAAEIAARVEAALAKIGQVLEGKVRVRWARSS